MLLMWVLLKYFLKRKECHVSNLSLHPDHLADLRQSGLSDDTILDAAIKSVRPAEINKIFGYETCAKSAYEIPYPGTNYSRYRMFYDDANKINQKTGKPRPKYLQKKELAIGFIFLILSDQYSTTPLYLYILQRAKKNV